MIPMNGMCQVTGNQMCLSELVCPQQARSCTMHQALPGQEGYAKSMPADLCVLSNMSDLDRFVVS